MKPYFETELGKLYCGDCLEIMPQLEPVDLVLTDPPYGLNENARRVASREKLARAIDYGDFKWDRKSASVEEIEKTISTGKNSIIWGGNYFNVPPSRGWLVWDKLNGGNDFADCELVWTNLTIAVRLFRFRWAGMLQGDMKNKEGRFHPTQKPVKVIKWCLSFCPNVETILDPFMGSGTILRAAKDLGCKAIGIEIEEKYCEIAVERLRQEVFQWA